jgi:hypothetical protein
MAVEEKYRRLPGRKRGLGTGASMWMGSDHILLVRSAWFREEYKRFYLRDIQAIVVADCPRFHVSAPMLWFALAWLIALAALPSAYDSAWLFASLGMVAAWLVISMRASCRCRLYTAVSKDDLPSLYRTWSARRFLREVQPLVAQVQGVVDATWADAEGSAAGPAVAAFAPPEPQPRRAARAHTPASDLFVLSLFVGSVVGLGTIHSSYTGWFQINSGLTLLQLACAVAVLVQYSRGGLVRAMQRLAIAALVLVGVTFYVQTFTYSFTMMASGTLVQRDRSVSPPPPVIVIHEATNAAGLLLAFIGMAIILRGSYGHDPDIIED